MEIIKTFKSKSGASLLLAAIAPGERHRFDQFIETESGDAYIVLPVPKLNELPIDIDELDTLVFNSHFGEEATGLLKLVDVHSRELLSAGNPLLQTDIPRANHFLATKNNNLFVYHGNRQSGITTKISEYAKAFSQTRKIVAFCHGASAVKEIGDLIIDGVLLNKTPALMVSIAEKEMGQCVVVIDDYQRYLSDEDLVTVANACPNVIIIAGMSFDK